MESFTNERALVQAARDHLDEWLYGARVGAYGTLFESEPPALTGAELALLDHIDSELSRQTGDGLWGADQYGIVAGSDRGPTEGPEVVCVYHPTIPDESVRGTGSLDESTRAEFNDVLWTYCELVTELLQEEFDAFREAAAAADEE